MSHGCRYGASISLHYGGVLWQPSTLFSKWNAFPLECTGEKGRLRVGHVTRDRQGWAAVPTPTSLGWNYTKGMWKGRDVRRQGVIGVCAFHWSWVNYCNRIFVMCASAYLWVCACACTCVCVACVCLWVFVCDCPWVCGFCLHIRACTCTWQLC